MPPSIPKSPIGALFRMRCSNTKPNSHTRAFTTTTSLSSIGPENPRFIEIPTTLQPQHIPKRDIKGVLPVPRDLFAKNLKHDKLSSKYFEETTPISSNKSESANDYVAWKREMAATRRKNLQEGLKALHTRQVRTDLSVARRSEARSKAREQRLHAPQREDERLTSPTITEAMSQLQIGAIPDPRRRARVNKKKLRVAARAAANEESRRNALHTLYMHARSFITTEEQLDQTIDKIFIERPFFNENSNSALPIDSNNIWSAQGSPPTIQEMLSALNGTQKQALDFHSGPAVITGKRMKKIAEELTGGKMDG